MNNNSEYEADKVNENLDDTELLGDVLDAAFKEDDEEEENFVVDIGIEDGLSEELEEKGTDIDYLDFDDDEGDTPPEINLDDLKDDM